MPIWFIEEIMPIVDYEHKAILEEKKFFNNQKISETNKGYVKKFLDVYDVSAARKVIFFQKISNLLVLTDDIKRDMQDSDVINKIRKNLKDSMGLNSYDTITGVGNRFCTWLNGGTKPAGMKDFKGVPKKDKKRNLSRNDMITWNEGLKHSNNADTIQLSAVVPVMLDGGFRPSEFIDLNYGDIERDGKFIIVHIRNGKTGARDVILYKSVPYLLRWYNHHPTKKNDDPLWVMERPQMARIK
jgi:integrase